MSRVQFRTRYGDAIIMRIALILPLAALAACNSQEEPTPAPTESAMPTPAPTPAVASSGETVTPAGFEKMDIPPALQGRWGMVPADCEPGRADAKGLLVIGARRLEFYESVGTLDELDEMEPTRIRGDFDFMGEGMEWDRDVTLELQDSGATLIRREAGDGAEPGPFRYSKCA